MLQGLGLLEILLESGKLAHLLVVGFEIREVNKRLGLPRICWIITHTVKVVDCFEHHKVWNGELVAAEERLRLETRDDGAETITSRSIDSIFVISAKAWLDHLVNEGVV